ncbi:hypothetical protein vseg_005101 [Gypsophila vaccaria]
MIVCQICGDRGYSHLLVNCVQCQDVAVHRYCIVGPAIFNDEGFKWSCEDCVLENTKPASPCRKSGRLISTVKRIATRNKARKKEINVLSPPQDQNPAGSLTETVKGATDISVLDPKNKDGSVNRKQAENKELVNPVVHHAQDNTEAIHAELNSNNDLKKGSFGAVQIRGQKIKNANLSDRTSLEQVNLAKNVGSLSSKVQDPKNNDGSLKRKQAENKEQSKHILHHAPDATDVTHEELNSSNDLKKRSSEAVQIRGQKIENANTFDRTGLEKVNLAKNVSSLSSKVQDQKINDGTAKRKQAENKEQRNLVLQHALDASEVVHNDLNSNNDLKKGSSEAVQIRGQKIKNVNSSDRTELEHVKLAKNVGSLLSKVQDQKNNDVNEKRKQHSNSIFHHAPDATEVVIEELKSDNDFKKRSFEAAQIRGQKIMNVNSFDRTGLGRVKLAKNVDTLSSKVRDHVKESTCVAGGNIPGDSKLSAEQNLPDLCPPRKDNNIDDNIVSAEEGGLKVTVLDNSSCEFHPEIIKETNINKNISRDSDWADRADNKILGVEELKADVSDRQAPRKKRRFIIEMYSDEEPVFVVAEHPQHVSDIGKGSLCKSSSEALSKLSYDGLAQLSSVELVPLRPSPMKVDDCVLSRETSVVFDNHDLAQPSRVNFVNNVPAQPSNDVVWRGCFRISDREYSTPLVLEARLSINAHENVHAAALTLPELFNFDLVPKRYSWPMNFEKPCLNSNEIGLYFFPVDERDEKSYEFIIDKMIENGLILKSVLNDLELLIFCSLELPREERTIRRKYYLWGVFKTRKETNLPNEPSNLHISNVRLPMPVPIPVPVPAEYPSDGIYHLKEVGTSRAINTSLCSSSLVDNIDGHQNVVRLPDELTQTISPELLQRPHDKQGYNSRQRGWKKHHVSYKEDYHRHSRKPCRIPDRERHFDVEFSGYDNKRHRNLEVSGYDNKRHRDVEFSGYDNKRHRNVEVSGYDDKRHRDVEFSGYDNKIHRNVEVSGYDNKRHRDVEFSGYDNKCHLNVEVSGYDNVRHRDVEFSGYDRRNVEVSGYDNKRHRDVEVSGYDDKRHRNVEVSGYANKRHRDVEFSGYDRECSSRWRKHAPKWKDRGVKDSRHSYRRC